MTTACLHRVAPVWAHLFAHSQRWSPQYTCVRLPNKRECAHSHDPSCHMSTDGRDVSRVTRVLAEWPRDCCCALTGQEVDGRAGPLHDSKYFKVVRSPEVQKQAVCHQRHCPRLMCLVAIQHAQHVATCGPSSWDYEDSGRPPELVAAEERLPTHVFAYFRRALTIVRQVQLNAHLNRGSGAEAKKKPGVGASTSYDRDNGKHPELWPWSVALWHGAEDGDYELLCAVFARMERWSLADVDAAIRVCADMRCFTLLLQHRPLELGQAMPLPAAHPILASVFSSPCMSQAFTWLAGRGLVSLSPACPSRDYNADLLPWLSHLVYSSDYSLHDTGPAEAICRAMLPAVGWECVDCAVKVWLFRLATSVCEACERFRKADAATVMWPPGAPQCAPPWAAYARSMHAVLLAAHAVPRDAPRPAGGAHAHECADSFKRTFMDPWTKQRGIPTAATGDALLRLCAALPTARQRVDALMVLQRCTALDWCYAPSWVSFFDACGNGGMDAALKQWLSEYFGKKLVVCADNGLLSQQCGLPMHNDVHLCVMNLLQEAIEYGSSCFPSDTNYAFGAKLCVPTHTELRVVVGEDCYQWWERTTCPSEDAAIARLELLASVTYLDSLTDQCADSTRLLPLGIAARNGFDRVQQHAVLLRIRDSLYCQPVAEHCLAAAAGCDYTPLSTVRHVREWFVNPDECDVFEAALVAALAACWGAMRRALSPLQDLGEPDDADDIDDDECGLDGPAQKALREARAKIIARHQAVINYLSGQLDAEAKAKA